LLVVVVQALTEVKDPDHQPEQKGRYERELDQGRAALIAEERT
jgi:hypothetical protein